MEKNASTDFTPHVLYKRPFVVQNKLSLLLQNIFKITKALEL